MTSTYATGTAPVAPVPAPSRAPVSRIFALVAGLIAGALALGVAELVASFSRSWRSPITDVGNRVVDNVPNSVKDLAIEWFGESDKVALQIGIGVILAVYAAVMGWILFRRSLWIGLVGIAVFGLIGAWSSLSTAGSPKSAVLPSLVGAAAAGGMLYLLHRRLAVSAGPDAITAPPGTRRDLEIYAEDADGDQDEAGSSEPSGERHDDRPLSSHLARRSFLTRSGLILAGSAATAGGLYTLGRARRYSAASSRADVRLPGAAETAGRVPDAVQFDVEGITPFVTSNQSFYRVDTAIEVPQIPADTYELKVNGYVDEELTFSFEDLLDRELIERDITLTCVSNQVGGNLAGTARWLGTRLAPILEEAGVQSKADQVIGRSSDGYTCGFPVDVAMDGRDAMIVVGMNGEPLPLEHGFPVRLVVPGLYGYVSATKWLTEIELSRFDEFDHYWLRRNWAAEAPIKTMSRIDTPRGLSRVSGTITIAGVAWAQTRGIDAVEVQIDDGAWERAELAEALNDVTWRQWKFDWDAKGAGQHQIRVRATDGTGAIQTADRVEPIPDGASGHHQIVVLVS